MPIPHVGRLVKELMLLGPAREMHCGAALCRLLDWRDASLDAHALAHLGRNGKLLLALSGVFTGSTRVPSFAFHSCGHCQEKMICLLPGHSPMTIWCLLLKSCGVWYNPADFSAIVADQALNCYKQQNGCNN